MENARAVENSRLVLGHSIGGFALGLEAAGMQTVGFCEVDPFCREWLAQQWPGVPIYPDIRTLDGRAIGFVDIVCGGFPCTDISAAGRGAGLAGKHSGLWFEMYRIVREVRPTWVVIENVPRLRTLGADRVYSDMEQTGYTGWFFVVGADDVGAPHRRKRAWGIFRRMADADRDAIRLIEQRIAGGRARGIRDQGQAEPRSDGSGGSTWNVADADGEVGRHGHGSSDAEFGDGCGEIRTGEKELGRRGGAVADAARHGTDGRPARQRVVDGGVGGRGPVELGAERAEDRPVADADDDGRRRVEPLGGSPRRDAEPAGFGEERVADAEGRGLRADGRTPGQAGHPHLGDPDVANATAGDHKGSGSRTTSDSAAHPGVSLTDAAVHGLTAQDTASRTWCTPTSRDWKDTPGMAQRDPKLHGGVLLPMQVFALDSQPDPANPNTPGSATAQHRMLNASWVLQLMGYPDTWARLSTRRDSRQQATLSCLESLSSSDESS